MSIACTYRGVGYGFELPPGYRECEYLESTGTQWIDTGHYATHLSGVHIRYAYLRKGKSWVFGGRKDGSYSYANEAFALIDTNNESGIGDIIFIGQNRAFIADRAGRAVQGHIYDAKVNVDADQKVYLDGVYYFQGSTTAQFYQPVSTVMFADRQNYNSMSVGTVAIYSCTIYDNTIPIMNFVPCLDYNGIPCMYDTVGKKPYYNQGTGTFNYKLKPQDIYYQLPEGYLECEYLESDGEKYIDTGITPGAGYGFSITYYIESPTGTGPSCKLLGSSVYNGGLLGGISISSWENGAYTFFSGYNRKALTFGSKATISFIDGICNWNGEKFTCNKASDDYPNIHGSVWIMRVNSDATNFSRNNGRYYNFKTYHYTDVIQNFIPALDPLGVPCMYDTVGKKPYYNQGTGTFNYKLK